MRTVVFLMGFLVLMSGCAGVSITPLSTGEAKKLHGEKNLKKGYVIYQPMVVVEISEKKLCVKKNEKDDCKEETQCVAGKPFVLPDYRKPYLLNIESGFGKTGVELELTDGWLLSKVKDESDNTAVLAA